MMPGKLLKNGPLNLLLLSNLLLPLLLLTTPGHSYLTEMSKRQKHLLITGASRGIGYETARALAGEGHKVTATARSADALSRLEQLHPELIDTVPADLTRPADVRMLSDYLETNNIRLAGLIHNAGLLINKPFGELTDNDWADMLEVNLMGPVRLTRSLVSQLETECHILNISSMGGYQQSSKFAGLSGYSTAKGALGILTECLAVELADKYIRVNCLCLGAVQTEMLEEAFPGMNAPVSAFGMGQYIAGFVLEGHRFFNGKILPVSLSDPD